MQAYITLAVALAAPALIEGIAVAAFRDRLGYEREIDSTRYNQVPKVFDFVLNSEYLASQKNRAKLVTKLRPEETIAADNVILESNIVLVRPPKRVAEKPQVGDGVSQELVRRRRGYNLENVRVPARYPYLPVANFNRFRRWG